ncbi:hypothetical protein JM18_007227 [Phytophthora kernoviae]|uniref:Tudor domain-containing protein n=2 Tax=Phytophthora kernoviae TaxID=325452 RepID=A0A921V5B2_9STRA|nr:hypothetical protein G195_010081 [Phytophthora kernoviae 00238/432]KAG2520212.1 hypothetical protein JM18_007227 [Phytophthora kernoviae]
MMTEQPIYGIGERVDGLYDENTDGMWYPGRIQCVHPGEDGFMFEVLYDDGEVEMHVRSEFLRKHVPGTICVGTRVLCRYDGGDEYYTGQVSDVQENGRYTIAYDDGEVEEDVPLDHIVEPEENEEEVEPSKAMNDVEPAQALQGGDEDVEAQTYSVHTRQVHYYACEGKQDGGVIVGSAGAL